MALVVKRHNQKLIPSTFNGYIPCSIVLVQDTIFYLLLCVPLQNSPTHLTLLLNNVYVCVSQAGAQRIKYLKTVVVFL